MTKTKSKLAATALASGVIFLTAFALAGSWKLPESDKANFTIDGMLGVDVSGTLDFNEAILQFSPDDIAHARLDVSLKVTSINTGIGKRDNHLKTDDFFDATKYPIITFHSTAVQKINGNSYKVTGDLGIKGVTKTVTIPFTFAGSGNNATFKGDFTINRMDYKVGEKQKMGVGKEVRISLNVPVVAQ